MTITLTACSLSPELEQPELDIPASYKEQASGAQMAPPEGVWKPVPPMAQEAQAEWWRIFGDEYLNVLEQQAMAGNQSLQAAAARVEVARATLRANESVFLPKIEIGANAVRSKPSGAGVAAFGGPVGTQLKPYTLYSAQGVATYELDLFGRVREGEKAYVYDAAAREADFHAVLLALQADVAQHYFSLRALDAERQMLRDTLAIREEAARIMRLRFEAGEAGEENHSRAQAELASVTAELLALDRQRAVMEHALAVLLGRMPSEFMLPEIPLQDLVPPRIPAGLPSTLLTRRPDIHAAQAAMAAANARIGVARTAFFPQVILTASGGYESTSLSDIFLWSNRSWALGQLAGSAISMTLFDSGRNIARVDAAFSAFDEAVANYRQQVLVAFRDVEDNLAAQRLLAGQALAQDAAAAAATRATGLTQRRYEEGDVDYFDLVNAQRDSLAAGRMAVQTHGQRLIATVALIRALGGGWEQPEPPSSESPISGPLLE